MSRIAFTAAAAHVATVGMQLRYNDLLFCPDRVTPSATAGRGGVDLTEGYYLLREGDPRETFCLP